MSLKLSQITDGGALAPATDKLVTVRSGATDVLTTPGTAAAKAASDNTKSVVASVSGTINTNHVAQFADAAGTVKDGGVLGSAAAATASSASGTVAAVSGGTTAGHIATFSDTAGTIQDGGVNTTGTVTTVSIVSANGLAGTVATATTTPAITLTTSITGLLKGNGTAISAASAGTDYVAPSTTVNGHALSSNVVVSASDITTGTLPAGQLPTATTVALGAVKVDGTTITISGGVISAASSGPAYVAGSGTATASGTSSFAAGTSAVATGTEDIAIGHSASNAGNTTGNNTAIGTGSGCSGSGNTTATNGIFIGNGSSPTFNAVGAPVAIGYSTIAHTAGVAIGNGAQASAAGAISIGDRNASAANDMVFGNGTTHKITYVASTLVTTLPGALTVTSAILLKSNTTFTDGAAASVGTLTNAPAAGNPTKWIPVNDNGTTRYIPAW